MTAVNPFHLPVPIRGTSPVCRARQILEPIIAEHMEGFGTALEGTMPQASPERVRAHTLLRIAASAYEQAVHVGRAVAAKQNPFRAYEADLGASTLNANITSFVTQMVHMSLQVFPRLLAPNLVSVQPFTQPSGYVFWLKRVAKDNGAGGGGSGRELSDLSQFDPDFSDRAAEGDQVKAVGMTLEKELVQVTYRALMHQYSHEVDVALRSQYGINIEAFGDVMTADELAWEVDRTVIADLVSFAATNPRGDLVFDPTAGGAYAGYSPSEKKAYDQGFVTNTMTQASVEMASDVYRQPNWHLAGTNVIKLLARTPEGYSEFRNSQAMADQVKVTGSIISSGRVNGGTIWHDPQLDPNLMISGYVENNNPFYAGYIFSPFGIASLLTAAFQDPDNLLTKKSRALAFAQKGVRAGQFRRIRIGQS